VNAIVSRFTFLSSIWSIAAACGSTVGASRHWHSQARAGHGLWSVGLTVWSVELKSSLAAKPFICCCFAFFMFSAVAPRAFAAPYSAGYQFSGGATARADSGDPAEPSDLKSFAPGLASGTLNKGLHTVLDGYALASTPRSSAFSSNTSTFTLNVDGGGSFASAMHYTLSGERRTGLFSPDGGAASVFTAAGAVVSFILDEPAAFKFLAGVEKTVNYQDPVVTIAGHTVPNVTGASAPYTVQVPAHSSFSLNIDAPWTNHSLGFYVDERDQSGFAYFGVRWGIDELPGTAPSHPIAMDSFDAANASPSQLGYLSSLPEDIGRACATTTVISDGSDSMLYFHTSILGDVGVSARTASAGQAFVFGSGGANITSATIPAEFGSASQFLVEFDGIQRHASLGQTLSFLDDAPGGIGSFRLIPLDGAASDDFVIGLQFTQAQLATICAGHAVPEPATWGLALCAAMCLTPFVRRRGRKYATASSCSVVGPALWITP